MGARKAGWKTVVVGALLLVGSGCSEDERMPIGLPTPPQKYCEGIGDTLRDDQCVFADGTSCELWSFYRGQCGQAHSACNLHGGAVSSVTTDLGTSTSISAQCTTASGKQCAEEDFWRTSSCP